MDTRKNVDNYREQYDILLAEDKVMDKAFKREFNDVSAVQQDQLYRLFKRRPRYLYLLHVVSRDVDYRNDKCYSAHYFLGNILFIMPPL